MPIYTINGHDIFVEEHGSRTRQLAVLIHGWSSSWYALSPLIIPISQRFHVMAVDLPGYGNSPRLPNRTSIRAYADLIADLIEQKGDGPAVLIGHSMGGMISMTVALHYPALVERMVLLAPTVTGRLSGMINTLISPVTFMESIGLGSMVVSATERAFVGLTDRMMRPVSFSDRSDITEADYLRLRQDARNPGQGRVRAECFLAMRDNDLSGKISAIEAPTLIIWGAEDNTVPLRDSGVVADEWPQADLRILPKAGHWPQFERPVETRRLVSAYLGLPQFSDTLHNPIDDAEYAEIKETALFLTHSDIGRELSDDHRIRLASQLFTRTYEPGEVIVRIQDSGNEMYVVRRGNVEVWNDPENPGPAAKNFVRVATLTPGQMTGEMAMLDGGVRSADLRAGAEGTELLILRRDRLLALAEDDPELGSKVLWNIANAMSLRGRFYLWQLQRAHQRAQDVEQQARRVITESGRFRAIRPGQN